MSSDSEHEESDGHFPAVLFSFVNAIPSTAAEQEQLRQTVRANATKYQWRHGKRFKSHSKHARGSKHQPPSASLTKVTRGSSTPHPKSFPQNSSQDDQLGTEDEVHVRSGTASMGSKILAIERMGSPQTILGAGHVDPFKSYSSTLPEKLVAKLFNHSVTHLPQLFCDNDNETANEWHSHVLSNAGLMNAFFYGSVSHRRLCRGSENWEDKSELVTTYSGAISALNKTLQDAVTIPCTDDVLLAVLCLAVNGARILPRRRIERPRQGPLQSLQMLDVYGSLDLIPVHALGLSELVRLRGGLEKVQMKGLAAIIPLSGILAATRDLVTPPFPFAPLKERADFIPAIAIKDLVMRNPSLRSVGAGFSASWPLSPSETASHHLFSILQNMGAYTILVSSYLTGYFLPSSLSIFIDARNFVQHGLMSCPPAATLANASTFDPFYECTRLVAIIYSIIVVFPLPTSSAPFDQLVACLRAELRRQDFPRTSPKAPVIILWILFMGGIAADDVDNRAWFVVALSRLPLRGKLNSWDGVSEVLNSFLWLGSTMDVDGRALWNEVNELRDFLK